MLSYIVNRVCEGKVTDMLLAILLLALLAMVFVISLLFSSVRGGNVVIKYSFVFIMGATFIASCAFFVYRMIDNTKYPTIGIEDKIFKFGDRYYSEIDGSYWLPIDLPDKTVAIIDSNDSGLFNNFSNWIVPTYLQVDNNQSILATSNSKDFLQFFVGTETEIPNLFETAFEEITLNFENRSIVIQDVDIANAIYEVQKRLLDGQFDYYYSYRSLIPVKRDVNRFQYDVNVKFPDFPCLYSNLIIVNTEDQKWVAFLREDSDVNNKEIITIYLSEDIIAYLTNLK